MDNITIRSSLVSRLALTVWLLVLAWRLFAPVNDGVVWIDYLFLFVLYGYIHITALGLGWLVLRRFKPNLTDLEGSVFAYMIGLGGISLGVAFVGFLGLFTPWGIFAILAASGIAASSAWVESIQGLKKAFQFSRFLTKLTSFEKSLVLLSLLTVPILLIHVLTPVWDYDALLYHLEVPRHFLAYGGIYFVQDMMRSAYPYLGEMLFAVGMLFRLDSLSKLVHLTYAALFVLSIYALGVRFFSRSAALTAVGIVVSVPSFVLWSTWASIDFAWAGYELWSVYFVSMWLKDENRDTKIALIFAGVMSGFAASTKYISLPILVLVAGLVAWFSLSKMKSGIGGSIRNLFVLGMPAVLVMGVWYLKNLILTGNPVYPLVYGGPGWDALENLVLNTYVQTFGIGKGILDLFQLPYTVYAYHERFSTMPQEIIHPLLWLAFLFPFLRKSRRYSFLIIYTFLYFIWWFFGSQVIRFLLPVSAFLALFAGDVIERFPKVPGNVLKIVFITGLMVYNFVFQVVTFRNSRAIDYIAGQRSSDDLLHLFVEDYGVKQYIQEELDPDERALFLWDGRGYYCDERCIADTEQAMAVGLALDSPPPEELSQKLLNMGITHLMFSANDAGFFIRLHDPEGLHRSAREYYLEKFLPTCGRSVFKDGGMELFEIDCNTK